MPNHGKCGIVVHSSVREAGRAGPGVCSQGGLPAATEVRILGNRRPSGKGYAAVEISLVIVQSNGKTQEVPVNKPRLVFGRKEECQVRLPVSSVSREHCELRVEGDKVLVRDLGSSNGTYVNAERVQEAQLSPGDLLAIGPAVFILRIDGQPAEINPAEAFARGAAPTPVSAAAAPKARPSAPTAGKPKPAPQTPKPASKEDSDFDLGASPLSDSSVSDFDFDFLDDDEENKKL